MTVLQEATGEDDSDLYLEEREAALAEEQANKRQMQRNIPGMLNPHELPEDMQDEQNMMSVSLMKMIECQLKLKNAAKLMIDDA